VTYLRQIMLEELKRHKYAGIIAESNPEPDPMLGFKNFESTAIKIAGTELVSRISKGQLAMTQRSSCACDGKQSLPPSRQSLTHSPHTHVHQSRVRMSK
jgi:hypothetical protein